MYAYDNAKSICLLDFLEMTRKLTSVKQVPSGRLDKVPVSLVLDDEFLHLSLVTCF